jgi:hypothetical protein
MYLIHIPLQGFGALKRHSKASTNDMLPQNHNFQENEFVVHAGLSNGVGTPFERHRTYGSHAGLISELLSFQRHAAKRSTAESDWRAAPRVVARNSANGTRALFGPLNPHMHCTATGS